MLSVIVDARGEPRKLPLLLAQLTAGAVEGVVREVLIVADPGDPGIDGICEETGAEACVSVEAAAGRAKSPYVLVLPADFRLRDGWIGSLTDFVACGGREAVVAGLGEGMFRKAPLGVLVERGRAGRMRGADLQRLRRELGLRPARVG